MDPLFDVDAFVNSLLWFFFLVFILWLLESLCGWVAGFFKEEENA